MGLPGFKNFFGASFSLVASLCSKILDGHRKIVLPPRCQDLNFRTTSLRCTFGANPSKMQLALIAAMARNRVIGQNNALIWHLPEDLKHFKNTTSGHHIIMGRKTYDSIGRPLPNRVNIVVSRNADLHIPGVMVVNSLEAAIQKAAADAQPFVVGGAQLYEAALPYATDLYLTQIDHDFEGDAFFPEFPESEWQLVARTDHHKEGPDGFNYSFLHFQRIANQLSF